MTKELILLVDDDRQVRRMMRTILRGQGYEVAEVGSGGEALEHIRSANYDVVLMDICMSGFSGIETCKVMRAESDVPIIMLTVSKSDKDKTEAFDAGADD